jgi:hypothetical protein
VDGQFDNALSDVNYFFARPGDLIVAEQRAVAAYD